MSTVYLKWKSWGGPEDAGMWFDSLMVRWKSRIRLIARKKIGLGKSKLEMHVMVHGGICMGDCLWLRLHRNANAAEWCLVGVG